MITTKKPCLHVKWIDLLARIVTIMLYPFVTIERSPPSHLMMCCLHVYVHDDSCVSFMLIIISGLLCTTDTLTLYCS